MAIVVGTDFSENATGAILAAAAVAKRLKARLYLVHVIDELGVELTMTSGQDAVYDPLRVRLADQAREIATQTGIDAVPLLVPGFAHRKLIDIAVAERARLLVVSALGREKQHRWLLGSVAERVAQAAPIPVLIVREKASLEAWARGERPLRVMVGVEMGATSKAALRWAMELRAMGACDVLVTHVVRPYSEHLRLGIAGPVPLDCLRPELEEVLVRDLRAWSGELSGGGETTFHVRSGVGTIHGHLALLAPEFKADLLVVGTHQRAGSARLWQESVSRGVLHIAPGNVVCVPRGPSTAADDALSTLRRVLIPTDFSELANRALRVGYGLVQAGGIVHLLHVVTGKPGEDDVAVIERLKALVPRGAAGKGVSTEVEVIEDRDAWSGIWHVSGRLGVDVICMATHGRSGISRVVLGSQAQEVLQRVRQPVVLVPPERED